MKNIVKLLRPHQWIKNTFIFLPIFFNGRMLQREYVILGIAIFFSYCLAASGVYCLNDIYDAEADRMHPIKCKRPIASGAISKEKGYVLMVMCILCSLSLILIYDWGTNKYMYLTIVVLLYLVMNIAYCIKLKQIAIVDVFVIAIGFVLRILAGSIATGIFLTHWIVLMTFLLALFLAFAKRRDDVVIYENTGVKIRKSVNRYTLSFMNQAISVVSSIIMICYIMYTVSPEVIERFHSSYVYLSSIFVLAGIIRYLQITIVNVKSGSPTKVLMKDRFIQLCLVGWLGTFAVLLYI